MTTEQRDEAPKQDDSFPTRQLTILAICRFAEPIAFCSILAYTYVMVQDLHNGDDTNASFYAGLLVSAFAVAEAMTAMIWGAVSDKYGRKPVVLMGLGGVALSSLIFGLAQKYWVALLARFIGGALNGNVAVMQTMVAEMVKKPEQEPRAYAVQPFVWALGSIVGSAMGGFLAQPARFYPSLFPEDGLFGRYPYLLPNLVAVAVIVLAIVQGIFLLEETNPLFHKKDDKSDQPNNDSILHNETSPLLRVTSRRISDGNQSTMSRASIIDGLREIRKQPAFLEESLPTSNNQTFDIRRSSFGTMYSISNGPAHMDPPQSDPSPKTFNFAVWMITGALVLVSYHQMAFAAIMPVYLLDNPDITGHRLDLIGGLGYTVHDVGVFMAVNGVIALFIQAFVFPFYVEKIGVWKSFFWLIVLYPISYIIMPFLSMLPINILPVGIYVSMALQNFFGIIVIPCALILLKNACPSPLVLGKVNGLAMSSCCGARTLSPPVVGIIYGAGGSAIGWWSCGIFAIIGVVQLFFVPREDVDRVSIHVPSKEENLPHNEHAVVVVDEAVED
ncbi:putative major facilitator superfamily transporter [Phaeomoniella chlamydospora]|uniref:Putative major facilitator superfamily transporter n=1 Tax=Phaeomoniella chlamydospora TaxID=158046 RepID=A0A0G2E662_PHACM|nr:putative major facilitator superfamily transporter [Phaeomoniella chlamydospora]